MSATQLTEDNSPFSFIDELLALGMISKEEHAQQSKLMAMDIVRQNRADMKRTEASQKAFPNQRLQPQPHSPEKQMNTRDLLNSMQLNNRIMSEQFKSLNTLVRPSPQRSVPDGDNLENTADLLNHMANSHLSNAAHSLQALANASVKARQQWALEQHDKAPTAQASTPDIVDVEVVEIKDRE